MKPPHREKRPPRPLDRARLEELGLAYVARIATTRAKLAAYLRRKLRERGWEGQGPPPVDEIAGRFAEAGYVDDRAFARARTGSLLRRGYGARRIEQALAAAGIDDGLRDEERPDGPQQRMAALAMARKRKFGPFGLSPPDRSQREKQLAAMLRSGHPLAYARALIEAADEDVALAWADVEENGTCG